MRLQLFDVGHGFCALLTGDNGNTVLFDSGHGDTFRPSVYLPVVGCTAVEQFIITNFDHDHVSDLHNLRRRVAIRSIWRNPSMPADRLRALKLEGGPLSEGLQAALDLHATYTAPIALPPDLGGVTLTHYWNTYPGFSDTNNLSYVTFIDYADLRIIIPGDIEVAGWKCLLLRADFQRALAATRVFVASHHGRESGYCEDVFQFCKPEITIISDEEMQYDTQEHCYSQHSSGLPWLDGSTRRVLTTRCDGHITISKISGQWGYCIQTRQGLPPR